MQRLILGAAAIFSFYATSGVIEPSLAQANDTQTPDKSQYWLLNPVPDSQCSGKLRARKALRAVR